MPYETAKLPQDEAFRELADMSPLPYTDDEREEYRIERAVRREEQANQREKEDQYDGTRFI